MISSWAQLTEFTGVNSPSSDMSLLKEQVSRDAQRLIALLRLAGWSDDLPSEKSEEQNK